MWKAWILIERLVLRGPHHVQFRRLNGLLPEPRSEMETATRETARKEFESLAKLMLGGHPAALGVLAGFLAWLRPSERGLLFIPGSLLIAGTAFAFLALVASIAEPTFRVRVWTKVQSLPNPTYEEQTTEHWATDEVMENSVQVLRGVVEWRILGAVKAGCLVLSGGAFIAALYATVVALDARP